MSYEYAGRVVRVVDGDTVRLEVSRELDSGPVDFGFYVFHRLRQTVSSTQNFRLYGINAPELKAPTLEAGRAATAKLTELLGLGALRITTFKPDKYGRWLAKIYVSAPQGELCVNDEMMSSGHAVPYLED